MGRLDDVIFPDDVEVDGNEHKSFKREVKKIERLGKKADKKTETVLVQYLTSKNQVVWKVCKIVAGNLVVIDNKVHELNPKKIWRHKKTLWYIVREIDRKPVSNQDYDQVVARGDDTDSDVPLIKAVLGAVQKQNIEQQSKLIWIILAIVAIAGLAFFFLYKG